MVKIFNHSILNANSAVVKKFFLICILFIFQFLFSKVLAAQQNYVTSSAKAGEGVSVLLNRFYLPVNNDNLRLFYEINKGKFDKNGGLIKGTVYKLPIIKLRYKDNSWLEQIETNDAVIIEMILNYNDKVTANRLKAAFEVQDIIWVPLYVIKSEPNRIETLNKAQTREQAKDQASLKKGDVVIEPLFGKSKEKVIIKDTRLSGYVFFLKSGHGGPDPGAIGYHNNIELHEDEYGYDVMLRLARNLMEHSATVYIIVQDSADGIRDDKYLKNSSKEVLMNGDTIAFNQRDRLKQRADLINQLSKKHEVNSQYAIVLHVDSRHTEKRIDIFFYHQENDKKSKSMTQSIFDMIKYKYDVNQPGRGYRGSMQTRNLYMLRNLNIPTVYIELGNIQNPKDQIRFLNYNNRQAIANWIRDGILKNISK